MKPPRHPPDARRAGFSLTELVVAFAVLALLAGPLYLLFTTSAKTVFSARDLQAASDLAGTTLAALSALPADSLSSAGAVDEALLPPVAAPGMTRTVTVEPVAAHGAAWLVARVVVRYPSPASGRMLEHASATLLPGVAPGGGAR